MCIGWVRPCDLMTRTSLPGQTEIPHFHHSSAGTLVASIFNGLRDAFKAKLRKSRMRTQVLTCICRRCFRLLAGIFFSFSAVFSQSANAPFWVGYDLPTPPPVAPGSVITIFVPGVGASLAGPVTAGSVPLPTTLAGISVTLAQNGSPAQSIPVPILAVRPMSTCLTPPAARGGVTCSGYAAITIEVPFELQNHNVPFSRFVVAENGVAGSAIEISPRVDAVHVLTSCDLNGDFSGLCNIGISITHADGTMVDLHHPAKSGEELVMYAFGLGATTPAVVTGQSATSPASASGPFRLNFDYRPNAPASYSNPQSQATPIYAGLSAGYVGLYQLNFIVPPPPAGTPQCNSVPLCLGTPSCIASNLTVSVIGAASFDGAGICVDTSSIAGPAAIASAASKARITSRQ